MNKFCKFAPSSSFPSKAGAALQFGLSARDAEWVATAEMAPQVKPKPPAGSSESPFNWGPEHKIFLMLNANELGGILGVLHGGKEFKVIHKSPMSAAPDKQTTTSLTATLSDTGDVGINMQQKKPGEKDFRRYNIYLQGGEIEVLRVLFRTMIEKIYFEIPGGKLKTLKVDVAPGVTDTGGTNG